MRCTAVVPETEDWMATVISCSYVALVLIFMDPCSSSCLLDYRGSVWSGLSVLRAMEQAGLGATLHSRCIIGVNSWPLDRKCVLYATCKACHTVCQGSIRTCSIRFRVMKTKWRVRWESKIHVFSLSYQTILNQKTLLMPRGNCLKHYFTSIKYLP